MPDWVETSKPYQGVDNVELRQGMVLRKVPFSVMQLGDIKFGTEENGGKAVVVQLNEAPLVTEVARADKVVVSPGIVLTPDCDIFQQKINRVVVAQLVSVEDHIKNQELNTAKERKMREDVDRARKENPGAFNLPGLFPLLADHALGFEDHLVLLESLTSMPITFAGGKPGFAITVESVCGLENLWFRVRHPALRARLINEFARHMLRLGLDDAGQS